MAVLRILIRRYPVFAVVVIAAALAMKLAVPAGFMPHFSGSTMTLQICNGMGTTAITVPVPGKGDTDKGRGHEKPGESPCAYSGLNAPALSGADPVILVLALALAFLVGLLAPASIDAPRIDRLRPPLRAPPIIA